MSEHLHTATVTKQQLLASLQSAVCPACGGLKKNRQTFCAGCWRRLPAAVGRALYKQFGQGYEAAVTTAWRILNPEQFHHAPAEQRSAER